MGRNRKSNDLKIIEGTWREDRHGPAAGALLADSAPEMPKGMSKDAQECWRGLIDRLHSTGRVSSEDSRSFLGLCEWWAEYRKVRRSLSKMAVSHKYYFRTQQLASVAWKAFCMAGAKFGLTPSDRAGMRVESKKPEGVKARNRA